MSPLRPSVIEILRRGGARIAEADDPIYQNAQWRIFFLYRPEKPKQEPPAPSTTDDDGDEAE